MKTTEDNEGIFQTFYKTYLKILICQSQNFWSFSVDLYLYQIIRSTNFSELPGISRVILQTSINEMKFFFLVLLMRTLPFSLFNKQFKFSINNSPIDDIFKENSLIEFGCDISPYFFDFHLKIWFEILAEYLFNHIIRHNTDQVTKMIE